MFHEPYWPLSFYTKGESFQEFSEFFFKDPEPKCGMCLFLVAQCP